jgi:tetratricopeptide (TPR) repeat protein
VISPDTAERAGGSDEVIDILRRARCVVIEHLRADDASYAEGRLRAQSRLAGLSAKIHGAGASEQIERWLEPSVYGWTAERPPLDWYAGAVAAHLLQFELPAAIGEHLLSAANYYGDFALVHALAAPLAATASTDTHFESLKQAGKAYKNIGDFERARTCYRSALLHASVRRDDALVAYFLLLYAKLCDHYQQRIAWHRALHRIAHRRFEALRESHRGDHFARWLQISEDACAKVDPTDAERLFARAERGVVFGTDAYVRTSWHRKEWEINNHLARPELPIQGDVERWMSDLVELTEMAAELGNERAWNVRMLQYTQIARKLGERFTNRGVPPPAILVPLFEGSALVHIADVERGARKLSDRRTIAMAASEQARWRLLLARESSRGVLDHDREAAIRDLEEASAQLTLSTDWMFDIYYNVTVELGELYAQMGRWPLAVRLYKDAYHYCKRLVTGIEDDEKKLAIIGESDSPELSVLTPDERSELCGELRHDYLVLLGRALDIGERLERVQTERMEHAQALRIRRGAMRYHRISEVLRQADPVRGEPRQISEVLVEVDDLLFQWKKSDHSDVRSIDLASQIRRIAKDWSQVGFNRLEQRSVVLEFEDELLEYLISTVVHNALEAAERARIPRCMIELDLVERDGIVYLAAHDDVGNIDQLKSAVAMVNQRELPRSERGPGGGEGLLHLREYMMKALDLPQPWLVESRTDGWKTILIPLGRGQRNSKAR